MKTKNRELIKILRGMEALGYQVDSIEMLPETEFRPVPGGCLITIKASPLIEVPLSESSEQT